ncbi:MAG: hypothetical protein V1712_03885 [Patescibacteria group bacterium]
MSHKIVRMILAVLALLSIIFIYTLGNFPEVGWMDVVLLVTFVVLFITRFRAIIGRGFGHWSRFFFRTTR